VGIRSRGQKPEREREKKHNDIAPRENLVESYKLGENRRKEKTLF